jgi:DNA processing protein
VHAAERAAWLRLVLTPGVGPRTARELLAAFGLPEAIFSASTSALSRVVAAALAQRLAAAATDSEAQAIEATERWLSLDPRRALVTLADADYPQALLTTTDPPVLLFVAGRRDLLNRPALAVVGARNATQQGVANAEAFARALARAGLTIISGFALGIDAAAHRGALEDDDSGSTVAVLGTGIDVVYPRSNRDLAGRITARGAMVSEFPLATPAASHNFPRRNRIVAAMSGGVLVVEAALHSGALITARIAAECGREVLAIPGSIHSPLARGCHRLLREGAKLVETAQDVLDELRFAAAVPAALPAREAALPHPELRAALGHDLVPIDELARRSGRGAAAVAAALLELELLQYVERLPGNRYQRLR